MMNPVLIGEKLTNLRVESKKSREQVAVAIGCSASAVAMYETGKRIPRDDVKLKLAELYGVSIEEIFFAA